MDEQLVNLVGASDGDAKLYETWVSEARAASLRPETIQKLKRRGLVHTRLGELGEVWIVRGAKPTPEE